jgi:hypothetical protein
MDWIITGLNPGCSFIYLAVSGKDPCSRIHGLRIVEDVCIGIWEYKGIRE